MIPGIVTVLITDFFEAAQGTISGQSIHGCCHSASYSAFGIVALVLSGLGIGNPLVLAFIEGSHNS
jgi:hypothetical protein